MLRIFLLVCCAFGAAGCAIHPLPDDVTRLATREIVHHIRCEARMAIKQAIIDYLRKMDLIEFMNRLQSNQLPLDQLDLHLNELPTGVRANIVKYENAAISYDFTFDMTEQNGLAAEVDFANVLSHGLFSKPANGSSEQINFRRGRCTEDGSPENFAYPVSGRIGLGELVETFVDLNEFQRLTGSKAGDTVPTIADTFNFQTTLIGSVTPQVTLTPLNRLFNVSGASLAATTQRKDIHRVIVAMSLPPPPKGQPAPAVHGFLGSSTSSPRPSTAIERNNNAIDDAINRSIINRLGSPNLNLNLN
jgi:hypothetical protein